MKHAITIRPVDMSQILDLRWRILRAGLPRETACFEGDDEPTTLHLAAFRAQDIIACVTILQRPWENQPAWQLRGMAVEDEFQGSGIGAKLLEEVEQAVRYSHHSMRLWCNARTPATGFYRKYGWELVGDEFIYPTAGPHYKMTKLLE